MSKMLSAAAAAVLLLSACAGDGAGAADPGDAGTGMAVCAPGHPDCEDTVVVEDDEPTDHGAGEEGGDDDHRAEARSLLGLTEAELPADVRISRRGDEQMMLTEDYVVGRDTVELDDAGDGTFVVTAVTVELSSGPETYTE